MTHSERNLDNPAIYVGTYHKYNCGRLAGRWIDLTQYDNRADFYADCLELHKDEHDPELMFQDWKNIPDQYIGESYISDDFWDEYLPAVEEHGQDVVDAACACDIPVDKIGEAYQGQYNSDTEFAEEYADSCGLIPDGIGWPLSYIDWDRAAHDLMMDYTAHNGHYFDCTY